MRGRLYGFRVLRRTGVYVGTKPYCLLGIKLPGMGVKYRRLFMGLRKMTSYKVS